MISYTFIADSQSVSRTELVFKVMGWSRRMSRWTSVVQLHVACFVIHRRLDSTVP